ncbi:outer membrane protein assembly factor BamE [Pelagibacterium halotolerans]|uniref:outer membrane protein assembly factor BamE n=1 Tax=Pelagibacterium halotolerans TaxID=531813 RepID=UPI0038513F44
MPLRPVRLRLSSIAVAAALGVALAGCSGTGFIANRTLGYDIPDDAIAQIRPGVSRDLVEIVLGTPQTTSTFSGETAWYYIETKVTETAFGLQTVQERTVLAVYFGANNRVADKAVYTLEDGKVVAIEQRRTASFGEDQGFIEAILQSI